MRKHRLSRCLPRAALTCLLTASATAFAYAATTPGALPRLAPTALPTADATSLNELEALLAKIASSKADERQAALGRLHDAGAALLPAMAKKLSELRKTADRDAIEALITDARKQGRKKSPFDEEPRGHAAKAKSDQPSDESTGDWLAWVTAHPKPADPAYRDAVIILTIERALADIASTPAVRELINVYASFGDLFRIDVQHTLRRLGDRAVPALIEARKHDIEKVRHWASRQLDALGKAIPGEAVQIADPQILSDVLRAYGRTKDLDALRVVVSFASNDRVQVREAAREAVSSFGEAATWQLRDAYDTFTGQRPAPGSSWDKLAADLFAAQDRARLTEVYTTFEEGLARYKEGKLEEMAQLFDRVLARAPTFDRRADMVAGYFDLARKVESKKTDQALLLARKALRLDLDGPHAKALQSFLLTLEGEQQVTHGVADTIPFQRALEADPSNLRARNDLMRLESGASARVNPAYRYLAAMVIGVIATAAALLVGIWRSSPKATNLVERSRTQTGEAPLDHRL